MERMIVLMLTIVIGGFAIAAIGFGCLASTAESHTVQQLCAIGFLATAAATMVLATCVSFVKRRASTVR